MATVSEQIAKQIIAADGYYENDERVMMVVTYINIFNGKRSWAILYQRDVDSGRYYDCDGLQIEWEAN